MFQYQEKIDYQLLFRFDGRLIENMNWAMLEKSGKAVFPVIASHANKNGVAYPGEQTIAILAGLSTKHARQGINALQSLPDVEVVKYRTRRGKAKRFEFNKGAAGKGDFPFHKCIMETGMWSQLKPTAKALYPVIRYLSWFDLDLYRSLSDEEEFMAEGREDYSERRFEFCNAPKGEMAKLAGIHRDSIRAALSNLEENYLLKQDSLDGELIHIVYLKPNGTFYRRSFLNQQTIKRFKSEAEKY